MTKVTSPVAAEPVERGSRRPIVKRFNNLHRSSIQKESKRFMISVFVRRESRFHGFRRSSHPTMAALACVLFADRFSADCADRRPELRFALRRHNFWRDDEFSSAQARRVKPRKSKPRRRIRCLAACRRPSPRPASCR